MSKLPNSENPDDFLFSLSKKEPYQLPILNMQNKSIGELTIYRGQVTHVNDQPLYQFALTAGLKDYTVPGIVAHLRDLDEMQCRVLH